jgi:RNA-directed DNA polymerase
LKSRLLKALGRQEIIEKAWRVIQANARDSTSDEVRREIDAFAEEAGARIRSICWRLSRGRFEFGKAKGILQPKRDSDGRKTGKERPLVLASVQARIVQRAVLEVLLDHPALQAYVQTPHSFGGIRKVGSGASKKSARILVPSQPQ